MTNTLFGCGTFHSEKGCHAWGQSVCGNSILSIQFCCDSKTSLNLKSKERERKIKAMRCTKIKEERDYIWLEK